MRFESPLVLLLFLFVSAALASCGATSKDSDAGSEASSPASASTNGLGVTCPDGGCGAGQQCVKAPGPGAATETCEIKCSANAECPSGLRCNLPPIAPDSIVNTCVK